MSNFYHILILTIGFSGQFCYFMRMLWQWVVSERRKASVLPIAFWYWSLGGSILLLIYAILRRDPVFTLGQLTGFIVYTRNLVLWRGEKPGSQHETTVSLPPLPPQRNDASLDTQPMTGSAPQEQASRRPAAGKQERERDDNDRVRAPLPLDVVNYSLVAPCYNEATNLADFVAEWHDVLKSVGEPFEIVLVDDASTDGSFEVLRNLAGRYPELRALRLARRSGQSAALLAGIHASRGRWIITSDSDLQNDPRDLVQMIQATRDADLVCGWRKHRQDPQWRKLVSRIANWYRRRHLDDGVHDSGCGLKLMKREVALSLLPFDGVHRFIPAIAQIEGFKVSEVVVNHRPRQRERSKYTFFNRLIRPIQDLKGVAWYRRRRVHYEIAEEIAGTGVSSLRRIA